MALGRHGRVGDRAVIIPAIIHLPLAVFVAVAISVITAVAMSLFAIYVGSKRKNEKKAF